MIKTKVFKSTSAFVIISFLQPSLSFFLLPIYLNYFPVSDYGAYSLFNTITNLIGIIAALRISSSIYSYYYDYSHSNALVNKYIGNIIGFTIVTGVILVVISLFLGEIIFSLFNNDIISFYPLGLYSLITGIALSIILPYSILLRNKIEVKKFVFIQVFLVLTTVLLQTIFIIYLDMGIEGALQAKMIASLLTGAIVLVITSRHITFVFDKKMISSAIKFSLPLIPFSILNWIALYGDRFVLERYFNLDYVGTYSLLIAICSLILMGNEALIGGIQPHLYRYYADQKASNTKIRKIYVYYIMCVLFLTSCITLGGTYIHLITNNTGFIEIRQYLPIASLVYFLSSYSNLFKARLMFEKKTKVIARFYIIVFSIVFLLYFVLTPNFGIWALILANMTGHLTIAIFYYRHSDNSLKNEIDLKNFLLLPLLGVTIIVLFFSSNSIFGISMQNVAWGQFIFISLLFLLQLRKAGTVPYLRKLIGL